VARAAIHGVESGAAFDNLRIPRWALLRWERSLASPPALRRRAGTLWRAPARRPCRRRRWRLLRRLRRGIGTRIDDKRARGRERDGKCSGGT